jgi:uncharacterized tellurite resistance protein B-like protein
MRPRDFIDVLENPDKPPIATRDAQAELLLSVLAHVFVADRKLDPQELALMKRLAADVPDVEAYLEQLAGRALDLDALAAAFPDPQDRDDIITLAEHAVWGDSEVDSREWDVVDALVEKLEVVRP